MSGPGRASRRPRHCAPVQLLVADQSAEHPLLLAADGSEPSAAVAAVTETTAADYGPVSFTGFMLSSILWWLSCGAAIGRPVFPAGRHALGARQLTACCAIAFLVLALGFDPGSDQPGAFGDSPAGDVLEHNRWNVPGTHC